MTLGYYQPLDARINRLMTVVAERERRDRAEAITKNPKLGFVASELIQCTFPHRDPVGVQTYVRTNGLFRLIVESGRDPQTLEPYGIPYGKIPRFLNIFINTQVAATGSTRVEFGRNLHKFMRQIGLNPDNGSGKRSDYRRMMTRQTVCSRLGSLSPNFDRRRMCRCEPICSPLSQSMPGGRR